MAAETLTKSPLATLAPLGLFPKQAILKLAEAGGIVAPRPFIANQVQPASLDLRLGPKAYRLRASFLPRRGTSIEERLKTIALHEIDISQGAVLERGCVYLVELQEALRLPADVACTTNPKSSTGRLDVFSRVISDADSTFDRVPAGYHGKLYAEVSPRTFSVVVREGSRLNQARFRRGEALMSDAELMDLHRREALVDEAADIEGGLKLSVDLLGAGSGGVIGYRAQRHTNVIDVDKIAEYDIHDFWEPIEIRGRPELILDPGQFYILASRETVHIPPEAAAEMVPFDPVMGDFRVHYAGFFDPGFGSARAGGQRARAVLEVRSFEVPFTLEHGQTIGRLVFEKLSEEPDLLYGALPGSNYQSQGLRLSKHFKQQG
jgi:dCTP deaminase